MKKNFIIPSLLAVVAASAILGASVLGVSAYLSANDSVTNTFTVGENDTEIEEPDFEPQPEVKAGESYPKTVQITNVDGGDCYVRVKLVFSDDAVKDLVTLDINETDWTYNNGYYYYKAALASGETTTTLMTKVTVNADATAEELDAIGAFEIDVVSESCQKGDAVVYGQAWSFLEKNQ